MVALLLGRHGSGSYIHYSPLLWQYNLPIDSLLADTCGSAPGRVVLVNHFEAYFTPTIHYVVDLKSLHAFAYFLNFSRLSSNAVCAPVMPVGATASWGWLRVTLELDPL